MPQRKRTLYLKRTEDIIKMYNKLSALTYNGKKKYNHEYILERLKERFYLEPDTILKLIKKAA